MATNAHVYLRTHQLRGRLLRFGLADEGAELSRKAAAAAAGRAAKTLVKEGALRITQVALRKGTALPSHQVDGPASVQVLRGKLRVTTASGDLDLAPGALIAINAGIAHSAMALSDCVILITIAMPEARPAA